MQRDNYSDQQSKINVIGESINKCKELCDGITECINNCFNSSTPKPKPKPISNNNTTPGKSVKFRTNVDVGSTYDSETYDRSYKNSGGRKTRRKHKKNKRKIIRK
jgi:hypothetical protein